MVIEWDKLEVAEDLVEMVEYIVEWQARRYFKVKDGFFSNERIERIKFYVSQLTTFFTIKMREWKGCSSGEMIDK
jgi:hypothetical protein